MRNSNKENIPLNGATPYCVGRHNFVLLFAFLSLDNKSDTMQRALLPMIFCFFSVCFPFSNRAQDVPQDTVKVGMYITSIHDIDFKQKEYTITFWLWLKYKNRDFDFFNNLEIPQAKSVEKSFSTVDTSGGKVYMMMKLQCVMKDSWKIGNFPFDHQTLRLSLENSQFDSSALVFIPDTDGQYFDKRFALRGWKIDSCIISSSIKTYETGFGDESLAKPQVKYSTYRARLVITRDATGLFWKMFLGMYMAFLIAYICFYIHSDGMDSRFGLSVGALFAVVGNKYIIDSSLPESSSFTLVDTLHGITLFFIMVVIAANAYALKLIKRNEIERSVKFDNRMALVVLVTFLILNAFFIWQASSV